MMIIIRNIGGGGTFCGIPVHFYIRDARSAHATARFLLACRSAFFLKKNLEINLSDWMKNSGDFRKRMNPMNPLRSTRARNEP